MENRNLLLALGLILLVWMGYIQFFAPPAPVSPVAVDQPAATASSAPGAPESNTFSPVLAAAIPVSVPEREELRVIDTGVARITLSSRGGGVRQVELLDYPLSRASDAPPVSFFGESPAISVSLVLTGEEAFATSPTLSYHFLDETPAYQLAAGRELELVLVARLDNGLQVERSYHFTGGQYTYGVEVRLVNLGPIALQGRAGLAVVHPWADDREVSQFEFVGPVVLTKDDLEQVDVADVAKKSPVFEQVAWSGFEDKYFLDALIPFDSSVSRVILLKREGSVVNQFQGPFQVLAPGQALGLRFLAYTGPKDLDILRPLGHRLEEIVDFGFFSLIAKPLLIVLKFFYSYSGNYGVSIILLTVIIKLLFWPLTQKSYQSMKDMQRLQPEMQKLRERFKGDRERLNRELMELYKSHRVNPMGGCLPLLVQIPVFFALYKVLLVAIELRHAPFMLWITDLSVKDPYYITPLVMGATMFIQQKMTPTTLDPIQARIFTFMPIVFTFLFLNFPSGLVLYWLVNNVLTIGQQYLIHRKGSAPA